ncbi:MAG: hypothetical protein ACM30G_17795 [Micromonosporaceae bacterium]
MSEQNPSAESPEEQGSFGSVPGTGSASDASEQVGSAPPASETVGSAPPPAGGATADPGAPGPTAPGGPVAPSGPVAPAEAGTADAPASGPSKGANTLAWVLGALLVIVLALGVGWFFARNKVATYNVGDCLSAEANSTADASKVKKVDCSSEGAAVKVVGVVDGLTREQFDASEPPCSAYETAQSALWIGTTGKGKTYCLEPIAR